MAFNYQRGVRLVSVRPVPVALFPEPPFMREPVSVAAPVPLEPDGAGVVVEGEGIMRELLSPDG
jgi:hypothetical protein